MDIISREELGIQDLPKGPLTRWDGGVSELLGVTIHHFGSPDAGNTPAENRALVLAVDNGHERGEYKDIAYNFLFDDFGQVMEGRGWQFVTGANGTTFANTHYFAFCYVGNSGTDPFNEKAQDACGWLLSQAFKKGVGVEVVTHHKWTGTACPGSKATPWVNRGGWKKDLPATPKRVQFLLVDDDKVIDKSSIVPLAQSEERWKKFRNSDAGDKAHNRMAEEGSRGTVQFVRKVIL